MDSCQFLKTPKTYVDPRARFLSFESMKLPVSAVEKPAQDGGLSPTADEYIEILRRKTILSKCVESGKGSE